MSIDSLIVAFDKGLRTVFGTTQASRPVPPAPPGEEAMEEHERRHAAALMRVNHCGEVCAQALYQGQALSAGNGSLKAALVRAGEEEQDHLAWSAERIAELGGRTSILNPLWYAGSLAIGFAAGKLGDRWNLGFLAETEHQVERHLEGHLQRLSPRDQKTRVLIEAMKADEAGHARLARDLGAVELPEPVKRAMTLAARMMTTSSYWI